MITIIKIIIGDNNNKNNDSKKNKSYILAHRKVHTFRDRYPFKNIIEKRIFEI